VSLVEHHQLFGERREHLRTVVGDDDEVLDPNPPTPGEVDARLERPSVRTSTRSCPMRRAAFELSKPLR
jgi:hypothetical protein